MRIPQAVETGTYPQGIVRPERFMCDTDHIVMKFDYFAGAQSLAGRAAKLTLILMLAFAIAPPALAALYAPGATLDPACAPTDLNCGISTQVASSTANSIPYYAANGSILSATSTLSILQNGYVGIGTTSPFSPLSVTGNGYFSGSLNVGDALTTRSNLGLTYAASTQVNWFNITAWGDSLTNGTGGTPFPTQLANDLPGTTVSNQGVGGQTSTQIGVREGGVSTTATVTGGSIPSSGGVTVTFPSGYEPVTSQGPSGGTYGRIAGVLGLVTLSGATYTFTPTNGTTTVAVSGAVPFIVSTGTLNNGTVVIWAGRNNSGSPSQVEADIAAMVAALPSPKRYVILAVLNGSSEGTGTGAYTSITSINTYLASTYPNNYFDIRTYLVQHGLTDAGLAPTGQDSTDIGNDLPPTSLRFDNIHLNTFGYSVVAAQVAKWITNYNSTNSAIVTYPSLSSIFANPTFNALTIASTSSSAAIFTIASSTAATSPGLTVLANGMAGFGTSTPNSIVQINGPLNPGNNSFTGTAHLGLFLTSQTFGMSGLDFGGLNSVNPEARIAMTSTSNGSLLQFGTTGNYGSGITNTAMTIDWAGRVGLGTTTPNSVLQVNGPTSGVGLTGTAHLGLFLTTQAFGTSGVDFGGLNSVNPEARIAMTSTGAGSFLNFGTTANFASGITNTAMVIDPNGNVGVGSTTPYARLAVAGSGNTTGVNFQTTNSSNAPLFTILDNGTVGIGTTSPFTTLSVNGSGYFSTLSLGTALSVVNGGTGVASIASGFIPVGNGTSAIATSSSLFWDNSNGRLGVGTTSPVSALHIRTTSSVGTFTGTSHLGLTVDGSGYTGIDFADAGGSGNMVPKARIAMTDDATGSYLNLGTTAGWSSGITNTAMTINPGGNVGLGTTTPNSVLQVNGPTSGVGLTGTAHLGLFLTTQAFGFSGVDFGGLNSVNPEARIVMNTTGAGSFLSFGTTGNFSSGITTIGMTLNPNGNLGVGTSTAYSRLTLWGTDTAAGTAAMTISNSASTTEFQVFDNGSATLAGTLTQNSDRRLKTNVQPLDASSTLNAVITLDPVSFNWIDPSLGSMAQLGFIAQDVQQIFPALVSTTSPTTLTPNGTLGINYIGLIAPTIEAIKELAAQVKGFAQSITTAVLNATTGNFTNINGSKLCLDGTCVTGPQLQQLLQNSGQQGGSAPSNPIIITDGASTTSDAATIATSTDASAPSIDNATGSNSTNTDTASTTSN
jgi:hypothetical protein